MKRLTIEDLPLTLRAGDQIFVRTELAGGVKRWAVSFLIRVFTFTKRDREATVVNHVATVVGPVLEDVWNPRSKILDYKIAEALGSGGFQYRKLFEVYGDPMLHSFAISRNKIVTDRHRVIMLQACEHLLGKKYGYAKLGAHALDYMLTTIWNAAGAPGDVRLFRRLCRMEKYPMCSWSSLYIYAKAGVPFTTPADSGSPDDLWDECREKTPAIWTWYYYSPSLERAIFGYVSRRHQ